MINYKKHTQNTQLSILHLIPGGGHTATVRTFVRVFVPGKMSLKVSILFSQTIQITV